MWPKAPFSSGDVPERVIAKALAHVTRQGDCVVSLYSRGSHGYAQIGWHHGGRRTMALVHRIAFAYYKGPIPAGMTVDHTCRIRHCLNPDHLRLLTNADNAKDNGQMKTNPLSDRLCGRCGEPMALSQGKRTLLYCRSCNNKRTRERRSKQRDATF